MELSQTEVKGSRCNPDNPASLTMVKEGNSAPRNPWSTREAPVNLVSLIW